MKKSLVDRTRLISTSFLNKNINFYDEKLVYFNVFFIFAVKLCICLKRKTYTLKIYKMKARECPYCHKEISRYKCSHYFFHGTNSTIRCNHCNGEVKPSQEPIRFNYCFFLGICISYGAMNFFLYILKKDFISSLLYTFPIITILIVTLMALILKKIIFTKNT